MSILSWTRGQIVALVQDGLTREESIKHYDICKEIKEGKKTQGRIAEEFNIPDTRVIRHINKKKCPECHFPLGNPTKNILK